MKFVIVAICPSPANAAIISAEEVQCNAQNLSAQKDTERKGARLQKKNAYGKRS